MSNLFKFLTDLNIFLVVSPGIYTEKEAEEGKIYKRLNGKTCVLGTVCLVLQRCVSFIMVKFS